MACECCDPVVARDRLEDVLLWLPRGARKDLGRLVSRLVPNSTAGLFPSVLTSCWQPRGVCAGGGVDASWRTERPGGSSPLSRPRVLPDRHPHPDGWS
jgi:hypothetical protein